MKETWKFIQGYEGLYEVSTTGQIRSSERKVPMISRHGNPYMMTIHEKLLAPDVSGEYLRVTLCKDGKTERLSIHRIVAMTFMSNPENKKHVNHKDGNKYNNAVENLEWSTASENQKHAFETGLQKRTPGTLSPLAALTKEQVQVIRKKYVPRKYTQDRLAEEFGVTRGVIKDLLNGKTYKLD